MPASQDILNTFQTYQKARVTFVQKVADLAKQGPQSVDLMQNAGVMNLMKPLLSDNVIFIIVCILFYFCVCDPLIRFVIVYSDTWYSYGLK